MASLDWIFVFFGAAVALTGGWIQLHPERVIPGHGQGGPSQLGDWQLEPAARAQIRLLGACFLFMGAFFALQMTVDLTQLPWWAGTISGLVTAITAVALVYARARRQRRSGRRVIQQPPLAAKALELR